MAVSATAKNHLLFEYEESIKQIVNARAEEAAREKAQSAPESSAPAAASSPPSPPSQPVNPVPDVPKAAPAATTAPVPPAPAAPPEPVPSGRYGWPKPPRIRHPSIHITYPKSK
jgi:hypothetical protein